MERKASVDRCLETLGEMRDSSDTQAVHEVVRTLCEIADENPHMCHEIREHLDRLGLELSSSE